MCLLATILVLFCWNQNVHRSRRIWASAPNCILGSATAAVIRRHNFQHLRVCGARYMLRVLRQFYLSVRPFITLVHCVETAKHITHSSSTYSPISAGDIAYVVKCSYEM